MSKFKDFKKEYKRQKRIFGLDAIGKAFSKEDEYKIYEGVYNDYKLGLIDDGVWAKAIILSKGEEASIEANYLKLQFEKTVLEIKAGEQIHREWMENLDYVIQQEKKRKEEEILREKNRKAQAERDRETRAKAQYDEFIRKEQEEKERERKEKREKEIEKFNNFKAEWESKSIQQRLFGTILVNTKKLLIAFGFVAIVSIALFLFFYTQINESIQ